MKITNPDYQLQYHKMRYLKQPCVGQYVTLTKTGETAHCDYHNIQKTLVFMSGGAAALPFILPGMGVVAAGSAFAYTAGAQAVTGAAAGGVGSQLINFNYPVAGQIGKVIECTERWWGEPGFDIRIQWLQESILDLPIEYKLKLRKSDSWHLAKHLECIQKTPITPTVVTKCKPTEFEKTPKAGAIKQPVDGRSSKPSEEKVRLIRAIVKASHKLKRARKAFINAPEDIHPTDRTALVNAVHDAASAHARAMDAYDKYSK